MEKGDLLMLH